MQWEAFANKKENTAWHLYSLLLVYCFSFTDFFGTRSHVYIVRACIGDKKPVFSTIFATIKRLTYSWNRQGCTRTSVLFLLREKNIFRILFLTLFVAHIYYINCQLLPMFIYLLINIKKYCKNCRIIKILLKIV